MSTSVQLNITNVDYKRKDPVFWIEVKTDSSEYKLKRKRIPRYYSELEKLHNHLLYSIDDVLIPTLPPCPSPRFDREGQLVGRQWWFNIRLPNENITEIETGTVENTIQLWLNRISEHTRVISSEDLKEFVESEVGFRPTLSKFKSKQTRIRASEEDMDPEFKQCTEFLNSLSINLTQIASKFDKLIHEQNAIANIWMDLSSSWVYYGSMERNPALFILYKSIVKGYHQLYDIERSQTSAAVETLGKEIKYEIKNCESTQNAMKRRLNSLSDYLSSRKYTESSLRNVERLKSSLHIDRNQATEAILILEHARLKERENFQTFQRIDINLRNDIENRYKPNLTKDILRSIREYAKSQLYLEKKKLAIFEDIAASF